eukprot:GHVH01006862.1.p1 GENE.GHVH01006862.1~~GHVH01006862.1.p1  ORF type:complete len:573 (+),score=59.00 GHVH01006862.1:908-2626(+)
MPIREDSDMLNNSDLTLRTKSATSTSTTDRGRQSWQSRLNRRCSNITLDELIRLAEDDEINYVKLDKRTGRGWTRLWRAANLTIPFHYPPEESFAVMRKLRRSKNSLDVEFVNRMDIIGDIKYIVPKVLIGSGLIITVRMALIAAMNSLDGGVNSVRSRPPSLHTLSHNRLNNPWAKSRLKPTPPLIRKGSVSKRVTFQDVAGLKEAKCELTELVEFLKNPEKYHELGARLPRGALLSGPPGTGKTLLAKAVAGEANVPFYSVSGSDFMQIYVGIGAARVRELFDEARKSPVGAIVFIDELDAIGRRRSSHTGGSGGSDERENTLNQLLIEMDGFTENENVIVIAASNRCETLDAALTRPGRFDRAVECELPSVKDRQSILECHMCDVKLATDPAKGETQPNQEWSSRIAALTPGFSGAELSNLVNESAILAARDDRTGVSLADLEESVERLAFGLQMGGERPTAERLRKTAYHEAGHAILSWMLPNTDPPIKVSIVPRKNGVLGYSQQIPHEDRIDTQDSIRDTLAVLMGNRCSVMGSMLSFSTSYFCLNVFRRSLSRRNRIWPRVNRCPR